MEKKGAEKGPQQQKAAREGVHRASRFHRAVSRGGTFTKRPYSLLPAPTALRGFLVLIPERCSPRVFRQTPS